MSLKIALAQANFIVGDIAANVEKITTWHKKASAENADLIIFPEMAIVGYPPEDLVLRQSFQKSAMEAITQLAALTEKGAAIIVGGIWLEEGQLYNTCFLMDGGKIIHRQYKYNLPNYGVFDEKRVFAKGTMPEPVLWRNMRLGLMVCEDMWITETADHLAAQQSDMLIVINASPYDVQKHDVRLKLAHAITTKHHLPFLYINQVGGQDELVFDGNSFILSHEGAINVQLQDFKEDFLVTSWMKKDKFECESELVNQPKKSEESIYHAMMLGLRDYVEKNKFPGVVIGLSGGIDSALTAAVAVEALGSKRVRAVMMPSPYTSRESLEDAAHCAELLGIKLDIIAISPAMLAMNEMLVPAFEGKPADITEENIQSRIRGNILMAISNKLGAMVVTTGNKSEMAVGYATLYGDMCGGFNVLKDIYKTEVYKLSEWRNSKTIVIPERILTKAPSAELKPNQTDQDTLPPYDLLDAILERLIEKQLSVLEIVEQGYEKHIVERVAKMFYRAEYKRRQAAPGVKTTTMSFGRDRRYPLTSGWIG